MKLLPSTPVAAIAPGARITTRGWGEKTDGKPFVVIEVLEDGWVRCVNEDGRYRMFDRYVCEPLGEDG